MTSLLPSLFVLQLCLSISSVLPSALYLTQSNYAPCSFNSNSSIRILDCSNKGLTEVPSVESAMIVSAFYLDGNPIRSMGANAFVNLNRSLTLLSVTSTALMDRIDNLALAGLTGLKSLNIEAKDGSENSMNKINIDKLFSGLKALTNIRMSKVNIKELPISFGGGTNMGNVSFVRTAIASIDTNAFSNASNLRFLDLSNNPLNLGVTKMNWLGSAVNVETIVLGSCGITTDTMGQMPSIPRLRTIDLKSNKLARLDGNSFANVAASLEVLVLNNNEISDGNTQGLQSLLALKELYLLSNNYISAIPPEIKLLSTLEVLDLRGTRIAGIEADNFHPNSKLKTLKLDYTNSHSFHALAFVRVANLEEFTVSTSSLSTSSILDTTGTQRPGNWSVILSQIPRLRVLSLSGIGSNINEGGGITDSIWSTLRLLPSLQRLTLEYNSLSFIPEFYLSSFVNLSYINLKNNNISRLTSASLYRMGNVELLLQNNKLAFFDNCTLSMYNTLHIVSLGGNPFYCGCSMQWLWRRVHAEKRINLANMQCAHPPSLIGRGWQTLNASDFCSSGETAPSNCSVQALTTAKPTTSLPFQFEIFISKASESDVKLEATLSILKGTFNGYIVRYWAISRPEVVLNTSLIPITIASITLKVTVNEQYRYCYVLRNGSSFWLESTTNCRDFLLTGLTSAAVIAISVMAAIIGTALIFVLVCLVCKMLRHRQSARLKGQADEDPYAYVYPDEKQIGKQPTNQSQFQATLRPESKRFSKRSRPNLAGSRPSLATSTTTLSTSRMSSSVFAMQNGARPVSGHSMVLQHQNPMFLSGGVQPSRSMHSILHDPRARSGPLTQQQLSRSQDHLSCNPKSERGGRQLPPPPRQARSQELVLDVTQAAGRYQNRHQYPDQPPSLPPPRSQPSSSTSGPQSQAPSYTTYSGDGAYVPMSSAAVANLGESSTDQDQRLQLHMSSKYNDYLQEVQILQQEPVQSNGGIENSAFQIQETFGYYEMGQI